MAGAGHRCFGCSCFNDRAWQPALPYTDPQAEIRVTNNSPAMPAVGWDHRHCRKRRGVGLSFRLANSARDWPPKNRFLGILKAPRAGAKRCRTGLRLLKFRLDTRNAWVRNGCDWNVARVLSSGWRPPLLLWFELSGGHAESDTLPQGTAFRGVKTATRFNSRFAYRLGAE